MELVSSPPILDPSASFNVKSGTAKYTDQIAESRVIRHSYSLSTQHTLREAAAASTVLSTVC